MRVHEWWPKLLDFIAENRARPRQYGVWDCWQFTGGGVFIMTDVDYRERFPAYASLVEGARILAERGGAEAMMTELFGPAKHVAFAQRGDIVVVDLGEGLAGGLCLGVETATVSPGGIETVPTLSGAAAWTV
jgi:hypothetical protein